MKNIENDIRPFQKFCQGEIPVGMIGVRELVSNLDPRRKLYIGFTNNSCGVYRVDSCSKDSQIVEIYTYEYTASDTLTRMPPGEENIFESYSSKVLDLVDLSRPTCGGHMRAKIGI